MTQQEYDRYVDLFAEEGWRRFTDLYSEVRKATLEACPNAAVTNDQWQFARGQLAQLDAVLGFESYIHAVWEQENAEEESYEEDV